MSDAVKLGQAFLMCERISSVMAPLGDPGKLTTGVKRLSSRLLYLSVSSELRYKLLEERYSDTM